MRSEKNVKNLIYLFDFLPSLYYNNINNFTQCAVEELVNSSDFESDVLSTLQVRPLPAQLI